MVSLALGPDTPGPEAGSPLYGLFDEKRLAFFLPESSASATADGLPGPESSYDGGGAPSLSACGCSDAGIGACAGACGVDAGVDWGGSHWDLPVARLMKNLEQSLVRSA